MKKCILMVDDSASMRQMLIDLSIIHDITRA